MKNNFENYIRERITSSSYEEREISEALLSLYKKGYIDIDMGEGEPLISISDTGRDAYASMLLYYMTPVGEA